ncbi:universal stress protein [Kutzneria viridogrisea]|uniref:UspA domain-containing protein n=2 Tax=Kutzneria TaxID=43356 RepID=W5W8A7_9PSEU|nr:universal stress protein [Kutzneria albida]AHH96990.1 hypothetical protein KALB_3626 [Kutzneria albida DSM 43870]MBA8932045.1 nucleotide-binding universal stress UspA family protein [Kutzneria viridogrisea]
MTDKPIVVGHDGSESASRATAWAAAEAVRKGVSLVIVRCCPPVQADVPHLVPLPRSFDEALVEQAKSELQAAWEVTSAAAPTISVSTVFTRAQPVRALVEQSSLAQLIVLGSRGIGGVTGMFIGSTAVALAAHGRCPTAVVRSGTPNTGPVVLGVHDSLGAEAIEFAFDAAQRRDVPLLAVHTWQDRTLATGFSPVPYVVDADVVTAAGHKLIDETLAPVVDRYPGVAVHRVVVRERPALALIEQSKHAQLVVVGSHGRHAFSGAVLGSTSHALLHHAECPVVIARNPV